MKNIHKFFLCGALIVLLFPSHSSADERRFGYTYQTSVQPVGAREIEIWNTYRTGRTDLFRQFDNRMEFEFGVANNLGVSLYLNHSMAKIQTPTGFEHEQSFSISNEWKYKLLDPVADPVGLGLYGEWTLGTDETELEGKILLDKQIGKFLIAFNGVVEEEWEDALKENLTETESETQVEFDLGLAYFLASNFTLGVEARQHNVIKEGETEHSALFAGPAISYSTENWWATLSVMPQVMSFKEKTSGNLDLTEYEKVQARILFSFRL